MSLKFSDRPQLNSGSASAVDQLRSKLPADAQPIATAPRASSTPVIVYGSDVKGHWALAHRDSWHKLAPHKDFRTVAVSWRMNVEQTPHALSRSLPRKQQGIHRCQ